MLQALLAMGSMFEPPRECPWCEKPFEEGEDIHMECLREKHGGEIPEEMQRLIDAFHLDPKGEGERGVK